ncbi:MAG TPA: hypothetical protein VNP92_03025, partial [Actinophytocola sp.]|nr:hypothetical protein [Actinophytocola sp.]
PGPQGRAAAQPDRQLPSGTGWANPIPSWPLPGVESGVALMLQPAQLAVSVFFDVLKAQQQAWAAMTGAARKARDPNRY